MEAIVGTEKRLGTVAKDFVNHFEERLEAMDGKAMIVCMSRRICVDLYNQIVKLRPSWHSENDEAGVLKIVMTGSATDGPEWQQHIRDKRGREALGQRFKNASGHGLPAATHTSTKVTRVYFLLRQSK
jgi:type I restriction enzyme, R subunit